MAAAEPDAGARKVRWSSGSSFSASRLDSLREAEASIAPETLNDPTVSRFRDAALRSSEAGRR